MQCPPSRQEGPVFESTTASARPPTDRGGGRRGRACAPAPEPAWERPPARARAPERRRV